MTARRTLVGTLTRKTCWRRPNRGISGPESFSSISSRVSGKDDSQIRGLLNMTRNRNGLMLLVAVLAPTVGLAQNSGIQGVINDSSGAAIPAANVTVTNVATSVEYDAQSNETGFYSVPFLSPGTYTITAISEGFAPSTRENLKLDVQQIARVDFELSIGTGSIRDSASSTSTVTTTSEHPAAGPTSTTWTTSRSLTTSCGSVAAIA